MITLWLVLFFRLFNFCSEWGRGKKLTKANNYLIFQVSVNLLVVKSTMLTDTIRYSWKRCNYIHNFLCLFANSDSSIFMITLRNFPPCGIYIPNDCYIL